MKEAPLIWLALVTIGVLALACALITRYTPTAGRRMIERADGPRRGGPARWRADLFLNVMPSCSKKPSSRPGYDAWLVPEAFAAVRRLEKPVDIRTLILSISG